MKSSLFLSPGCPPIESSSLSKKEEVLQEDEANWMLAEFFDNIRAFPSEESVHLERLAEEIALVRFLSRNLKEAKSFVKPRYVYDD